MLTYHGAPGSNGNRIGVYGTVHGAGTESWAPAAANFAAGYRRQRWKVALDFSALHDVDGRAGTDDTRAEDALDVGGGFAERQLCTQRVRGGGDELERERDEAAVLGCGNGKPTRSRMMTPTVVYQGTWTEARGNYSGGSIRWTNTPGARVSCTYSANGDHWLYLGTRLADHGGQGLGAGRRSRSGDARPGEGG